MSAALMDAKPCAPARTADVDKKSFGKRLRELRTAAGLSQTALARLAGLRQSHISAWENGTNEPLITQVDKLARALGVDLNALGKPPTTEPPEPPRGRPRHPDGNPSPTPVAPFPGRKFGKKR